MNSYVAEFMRLKCAGDVLNVVGPMKKPDKEINEAMAIMRALRPIALGAPMKYTLVDVCSGNALVPILAVHLLPFKFCYAVDVRPHRPLYQVRRFKYLSEVDITGSFFSEWLDGLGEDVVLTASHPCKLANEVVNLYLTHTISHLAMIPCCRGDITTKLPRLVGEWGGYMQWCFSLWMRLHEASPASDIYVDKRCQLTPCNCVVTSSQE